MTGFADRFSQSQRAALAALGYAVLERRSAPHTAPPRMAFDLPPHEAASPPPTPDPHRAGLGPQPTAPSTQPRTTAAARDLPARVVIDGMDDSALARSILAAALSASGNDARVRQAGERLEIALGGSGDAWPLTLEQLRRSPKHKAALWRALRALARSPA